MSRRMDLSRRVTLFTTLGLGIFWLMAVVLMSLITRAEQAELFDMQLDETAHVLLPLVSQMQSIGATQHPEQPRPQPDLNEALAYRLLGRDGQVLQQSELAARIALTPDMTRNTERFSTVQDYRIYTTGFNGAGHAIQLAAPLAERREAFREATVGMAVPMLALLPLTWLLIGWITRRALAPMRQLSAQIAARDGSTLAVIDSGGWPRDLVEIAGTVNGFMARLSQTIDAERAFATNSAHELRNPVAIALAQVQQLRETTTAPSQIARIDALERALQRMRRLVARLLQLARADAGIGLSAQASDIAALTKLVMADVVPIAASGRVTTHLPDVSVMARIDPDAFAIVLGNLVENALQHSSDIVSITIRVGGVLEVANGGPTVRDLATLPRRFSRHKSDGFGLGLHICNQIVEQAGGRLELISPIPGRSNGFMARVTLPEAQATSGV